MALGQGSYPALRPYQLTAFDTDMVDGQLDRPSLADVPKIIRH